MEVSVNASGDLVLDVSVTRPDSATVVAQYVDSGSDKNTGDGVVGCAFTWLWSSHGRFDNFNVATRIPGDANGDGVVDGTDLGVWAANFGASPASLNMGDFNGDNVVDGIDLGIWSANFGAGAPAPSLAGETTIDQEQAPLAPSTTEASVEAAPPQLEGADTAEEIGGSITSPDAPDALVIETAEVVLSGPIAADARPRGRRTRPLRTAKTVKAPRPSALEDDRLSALELVPLATPL